MKETSKSKNTRNKIVVLLGVITLIIGFIALGKGPGPNNPISLTFAPLILCLAYLVIIPLGIIIPGKNDDKEDEAS